MAVFKEISPDAPIADKAMNWLDNRFPASKLYKEHLSEYYAPKNFNFWSSAHSPCWCWSSRSSRVFF